MKRITINIKNDENGNTTMYHNNETRFFLRSSVAQYVYKKTIAQVKRYEECMQYWVDTYNETGIGKDMIDYYYSCYRNELNELNNFIKSRGITKNDR